VSRALIRLLLARDAVRTIRGLVRELGDKKPLTKDEAYHPARREYEAWIKDEGNHRRHSEGLYGEGLFSGLAAKDERNRVLDVLDGS
jgi:hypothetical protein